MNSIEIVRAEPKETDGIKIVRAGDEPVKKKDETTLASPGTSEDTDGSSVTEPVEKIKSSESLDSKERIFTDYGTKATEGREYKLVGGKWQSRDKAAPEKVNLLSIFSSSKTPSHTQWKGVNNENRISALNDRFLKEAPTKKTFGKPATSADFQKQADVAAQKEMKWEETPAEKVIEPTATGKAKQDVFEEKFMALEKGTEEQVKLEAANKEKESFLNKFNSSLVSQNETDAISNFKNVIKEAGDKYDIFDFEEAEAGVDAMRVTNKLTGESINVSLDNWSDTRDQNEAEILKGFINVSISNPEYNQAIEDVNDMYIDLAKLDRGTMEWNEMNASLMEKRREVSSLRADRTDRALTNKYTANAIYNKMEAKSISSELFEISKQSGELDNAVKETNKWYSQVRENYDKGLISEEDWNNKWVPQIKAEEALLLEKQSDLKTDLQIIDEKSESLNQVAATHYLTQEFRGNVISGVGKSFMSGASNVFNFMTHTDPNYEFISGDDREASVKVKDMLPGVVTDEYLSSENRNILEQIAFGLSRSIGASVTGAAMTGGAGGAFGGFLGLYADGYENMQEQLNVPEMAGVTEGEKVLLSFAYGSTVGLLEKYGMTKAFSKSPLGKSFAGWVLQKTFKEIPKGASAELIDQMAKKNIKIGISKGLTNIVAGSVTEGSTELAQELSDISIKEVYNSVKGKGYFDTPDTWGDLASQAGNSALMGMLGGGLMNAASQSGNVLKRGFKGNNMGAVGDDMLKAVAMDPSLREIYETDLKVKVATKKMTYDESQSKLADLDMMTATLEKIPVEVPVGNRTEAFDLIVEKKNLEQEIEGKEPSLVKKKKERIEAIDEQLQGLAPQVTEDKPVVEDKKATPEKESFESAVTKGTSEAVKWLDDIDKKLSDFGKETLGVNIPVVVAQGAVKAAKLLAKTTNNVSEIVDAAITHVRESDWFKKLNESEQAKTTDDIKRLLSTGEIGEAVGTTPIAEEPGAETRKKAPSVDKVLDKPKAKKVVVDERTALRNQIMLESKAAKEGAKSEKDARKAIAGVVKESLSKTKGKYTAQQIRSVTARALKMNLSNPVMADRFVDYVEKVGNDAEYDSKVQAAFAGKKMVSKAARGKKQQAELKAGGKAFASINPRNVESIDEYLAMTAKLKGALTATTTKGGELILRNTSVMTEVNEYTAKEIARQEQLDRDMMALQFSEMFDSGILNDKMSIQEMREVINGIGGKEDGSIKNEAEIRSQIENVYDAYSAIIAESLKSKKDPFTGEDIDVTPEQVRIIRSVLGLDIKELPLKDLFNVVDMLGNFASNGAMSGVESTANYFIGKQEAKEFAKKYGKAKKMGKVLRAYDYHFASLPVLIETMLTGTSKALSFMNKSGLNGLIRGANYAQRESQKILNDFASEFHKKKPNGENFATAKNTYERGMYAFLNRNTPGTELEMKTEFERRVRIVNETIEYLNSNKASAVEEKKGKVYAELAEKLGITDEGVTQSDVDSKTDPINKEAAQWWVNKWGEHYDALKDVSLNVYNKELGSDTFYSPDRYKRKATNEVADVEEVVSGAFGEFNDTAYNKESNSLMEANRPKVLPKNRVIDLDFDINNFSMIEAALVDIHTAADIRKVSGFTQSDSFNEIFNAEDANILKKRINNYILRTRRKEAVRDDQTKVFKQIMNSVAKAGTSMALGGIDQMPKQTISVAFNTLINSQRKLGLVDAMRKDVREWIDASGMPISRRGVEAEANIDSAEKNLNKYSGHGREALRFAGKLQDVYLKTFLSNPDKYMARASFISYYRKSMSKQGLSSDINYNVPMNKTAAEYAQHMVDRQQNISDSNLAGEFFVNRTYTADLVKKVFFPFANFIMNQKARMYSDIRTLTSKESTSEDKTSARVSLTGLATEMVVFHGISIGIRTLYKELAQQITGYEPEKEDNDVIKAVERENILREKRGEEVFTEKEEARFRYEFVRDREQLKNKKTFWTSITKDLMSPLPATDEAPVKLFNVLANTFGVARKAKSKEATEAVKEENIIRMNKKGGKEMTPEEELEYRDKWSSEDQFTMWDFEDKGQSYGVLGIASEKGSELGDIYEAAFDGTVITGKNKTKKYLLPEDQEVSKVNFFGMLLYVSGVLPADVGKEARYIQKNIVKSALTKDQMDTYKAIKESDGEVSPEDLKAIKSGESLKAIKRRKARANMKFIQ